MALTDSTKALGLGMLLAPVLLVTSPGVVQESPPLPGPSSVKKGHWGGGEKGGEVICKGSSC